jgi:glycolate oxidase
MPAMFAEVDLETMRNIRLQIDPKEISNRGKMFPGGEVPALQVHGLHPLEKKGIISRE